MRDDNLVSNRETFFRKIAGFLGEKEARKWRENKGTSKLTMSEFLHHDIREMRVYHTTEGNFFPYMPLTSMFRVTHFSAF